jgi:hypothetical protein
MRNLVVASKKVFRGCFSWYWCLSYAVCGLKFQELLISIGFRSKNLKVHHQQALCCFHLLVSLAHYRVVSFISVCECKGKKNSHCELEVQLMYRVSSSKRKGRGKTK